MKADGGGLRAADGQAARIHEDRAETIEQKRPRDGKNQLEMRHNNEVSSEMRGFILAALIRTPAPSLSCSGGSSTIVAVAAEFITKSFSVHRLHIYMTTVCDRILL